MALIDEIKDLSVLTDVSFPTLKNGVCGLGTGKGYDGVDDRSHKPGVVSLGVNTYSASFLVNASNQLSSGVITSQQDGSASGIWSNLFGSDQMLIQARVTTSTNRLSYAKTGVGLEGAGLKHVVFTVDGANDLIKLYIEKVEQGEATTKFGTGYLSGHTAGMVASQFSVGKGQNFSTPYTGDVFFIRQFNHVLSQVEVDAEFDLAQNCGIFTDNRRGRGERGDYLLGGRRA